MQTADYITHNLIDIPAVMATLRNPNTGGMVLFSGEVRDSNKGKSVAFLEYEAYESMAREKIKEIVDFAITKWNLNDALCIHRLGRLEITDCAVVVITASKHRAEAYEANRYIIDRVKFEVPIWKNEHFTDGTNEWGNNSDCQCADPKHHSPISAFHAINPPSKLDIVANL